MITLSSPLPSITVPPIVNGYMQTGASENDLDSDGNTSEFSPCIPYQDDTVFANTFDP